MGPCKEEAGEYGIKPGMARVSRNLGVRSSSYRLGLARSAGFEATHLKESITNPQRPTALRAE